MGNENVQLITMLNFIYRNAASIEVVTQEVLNVSFHLPRRWREFELIIGIECIRVISKDDFLLVAESEYVMSMVLRLGYIALMPDAIYDDARCPRRITMDIFRAKLKAGEVQLWVQRRFHLDMKIRGNVTPSLHAHGHVAQFGDG